MYRISNGNAHVCLDEGCNYLEYSDGVTTVRSGSPIVFDWKQTARAISPADMLCKHVTCSESELRIELSDFRFPARFPGNDYYRPAKSFVPDFRFTVTFRLDGTDLVCELSPIANIGEEEINIQICPHFFRASTRECAQVVLPIDYGLRFDFPRTDIWSFGFSPSVNCSLPVHGLFRQHGGVGLWCDDLNRTYHFSYNTDASSSVSVNCYETFSSTYNDTRSMRFLLFRRGEDFRSLGLRCRALRKASGRFKSLAEKISEHGEVGSLPGTVLWKHNVYFKERPSGVEKSYSLYVARPDWNENEGLPNNWTASEIFSTAHERGFDRVAVCSTGWNRDGFDAGYPSKFPINSERGSESDFRSAVSYARSLSRDYVLSVHDNYTASYESGPEYDSHEIRQYVAGVVPRGPIYRGGHANPLCPAVALEHARHDMPRLASLTGRGLLYIDVCAGSGFTECKSPEHPLNRYEVLSTYRELFKLAKEHFGALVVEGCGTDPYADLVDIGAYGGLHSRFCTPLISGPFPVPIPLWQMVYHDSVLNYLGEGYFVSMAHGSEYLLYQALYTLLPTSFTDSQRRLSVELRHAYTSAMVDFEDLEPRTVTRTSDGSCVTHGVSRSVFGDGTEVIANFNETPFMYDGVTIPGRDFLVRRS